VTGLFAVVGAVVVGLRQADIQFLSLSGHKMHCPKGVGALYVNRKTRFAPLLIGGSQENGKRGGTQNVASIVGFGKACELVAAALQADAEHVRTLRDHFEGRVLAEVADVSINGDPANRLPNTTNLAFANVDSEALLLLLDDQGYVRVTDMGISRLWSPDNANDTSGTPGYMAPEVMCRQNHGVAVDYFALGILLFEFMMGRRPYIGKTRKEIRDKIFEKQVVLKKADLPEGWSLEAADFINKLI
jgi:hypothetical protein